VQAGLNWAIGWSKPAFDGASALRTERAAGPARRLRGLRAAGRGIPRPEMPVLDAAGQAVGQVTSGTFSPSLKVGIGLALVPADVVLGDTVGVGIRGRVEPFEVVKPPFVVSDVR
jgi:aminomethyltransferase